MGRGWIGYCFKRCVCAVGSSLLLDHARDASEVRRGCRYRKLERHICASGFSHGPDDPVIRTSSSLVLDPYSRDKIVSTYR